MQQRFVLVWILIVGLVPVAPPSALGQRKEPTIDRVLNSGSQGTEFFVAIPPNEVGTYPVVGLDIYIASAFDANVEFFDYASDKPTQYTIKPYQILTLSDNSKSGKPVLNWAMEVRDAETPTHKALRITSDKPISVYTINSKQYTTDGYMAIPVSGWGREYIPCAYYDFSEARPWPGGFLIIAREQTTVNIQLRGTGQGSASTSKGRKIGDKFSVLLDEGDVYMVHGDGTTRGQFDLTGSLISADKPVGVIGFHMRTTMPNLLINGNGRNHLCEMLPPTSAWGKNYATLELQRARLLAGRGDVFRVVAKDSNTKWSCKFYEKSSGKLLGQRGGTITAAGGFADEVQATQPTAAVEGFSVWEADKPIFLMQYSCSSSWDGDQILDPFMMSITPQEHYATTAIFQTPTMSQFSKHFLNLVVTTDTSDPNLIENLKSLEIDGQPVWNNGKATKPSLLFSRMPNGMYNAGLEFGTDACAHRVTSNGRVSFGGYLYGFGSVDSYGWPIGAGTVVKTVDTVSPVISKVASPTSCGGYLCEATEVRNDPNPPASAPNEGDQVETGISSITVVGPNDTSNFRLVLMTDSSFPRATSYKRFTYEWQVINKSRSARARYVVRDFAGNSALDSVVYTPAQTTDTSAPVVKRLLSKTTFWDLVATDTINVPNPPRQCPQDGDQIDRGLAEVSCDCTNMRILPGQLRFSPDSFVRKAEFSVAVEDIQLEATGIVLVRDRGSNVRRDTLRYSPATSVHDTDRTILPCNEMTLQTSGLLILARLTDANADMLTVTNIRGQVVQSVQPGTREPADEDGFWELGPFDPGVYVVSSGATATRCAQIVILSP